MNDQKRYYAIQNDQQIGPMTRDELKQLSYGGRDTRVWTDGFMDWVKVSSMQDMMVKMKMVENVTPAVHTSVEEHIAALMAQMSAGAVSADVSADRAGPVHAPRPYVAPDYAAPAAPQDPVTAAGYIYAGRWARFGLEVFNVILIFSIASQLGPRHPIIKLMSVAAIYGAVCHALFSGTLGHLIFQVKVVSEVNADDYKNPFKGALREIVKMVFRGFILPDIWLLWDGKVQNVYDKMFKTVVVKKTRITV